MDARAAARLSIFTWPLRTVFSCPIGLKIVYVVRWDAKNWTWISIPYPWESDRLAQKDAQKRTQICASDPPLPPSRGHQGITYDGAIGQYATVRASTERFGSCSHQLFSLAFVILRT
jgi:hypothetical protein